VKFLNKQQLKYFFINLKEHHFRHLFRKIIGHKRAHLKKSLVSCAVRQFEARLDSFVMKFGLSKPYQLNDVLRNRVITLNDATAFMKRAFLLNTGDVYSLGSAPAFQYYLARYIRLASSFFRKSHVYGKKRSLFLSKPLGRLFRRKRSLRKKTGKRKFLTKYKYRFLVNRKKKFIRRVKHNLFFFTLNVSKNKFFNKRAPLYIRLLRVFYPQRWINRRFRTKKKVASFSVFFRRRFLGLIKRTRKPKYMRFMLKRFFFKTVLKYRKFMFYRFYTKKASFRKLLRRNFPFKPWSLMMRWRTGYLLPDPFLHCVYFLEQPQAPRDMFFSFPFNIRNLLYVYQAVK